MAKAQDRRFLDNRDFTIYDRVGYADAVGATLVPVAGSKTWPTPAAAVSLEVVSDDNVNDKAGQAGALTVRVTGLDANFAEQTADVTLNGTTAVAVSGTWLRVNDFEVLTSGTYGQIGSPSHNSTIDVQVASGGAVWASILPTASHGEAKAEIAAYAVPTGKTAYIRDMHLEVEGGGTKTADLILFVRESADDTTTPYAPLKAEITIKALEGDESRPEILGPFTGPCDIVWTASAASGTDVGARFEVWTEDS